MVVLRSKKVAFFLGFYYGSTMVQKSSIFLGILLRYYSGLKVAPFLGFYFGCTGCTTVQKVAFFLGWDSITAVVLRYKK